MPQCATAVTLKRQLNIDAHDKIFVTHNKHLKFIIKENNLTLGQMDNGQWLANYKRLQECKTF